MSLDWTVLVTPFARQGVRALDAALREELIEQVALLCEDPFVALRRAAGWDAIPGAWVYEYESAAAEGLRIKLYFDEPDRVTLQLVMIAISHTAGADDAEADP